MSLTRIAPSEADSEDAGSSSNAPTIDAHPKTFANAFIQPSDLRNGPAILCEISPVYTDFHGSLKEATLPAYG
jgi:hypothetical protein